jgi:hypothetical protein
MSEGLVLGRWMRMKVRCHHCNRAVENVYVVSDPPISGMFSGKNCYQLARENYESTQRPETKEV